MTGSVLNTKGEVRLFLLILFLLSAVFYALLFISPGFPQRWDAYSVGFMWCPGLAALAAQFVMRRNLRGLGWGWGGFRYYLLAYGLPIAFCLVSYLPVWVVFHAFRPEAFSATAAKLGLTGAIGRVGLMLLVLAQPFLGMIVSFGEELGWRGFLVPRLQSTMSFTKTSLATGLIWAVWHYPVVIALFPLSRPGVPTWYALTCFSVIVVGISFVHSWLRLRSGSMWPSTLFHASGNAFLGSFQGLTQETATTAYVTFEYGLGLAVVMLPLAYLFWKIWQKDQPRRTAADN